MVLTSSVRSGDGRGDGTGKSAGDVLSSSTHRTVMGTAMFFGSNLLGKAFDQGTVARSIQVSSGQAVPPENAPGYPRMMNGRNGSFP